MKQHLLTLNALACIQLLPAVDIKQSPEAITVQLNDQVQMEWALHRIPTFSVCAKRP